VNRDGVESLYRSKALELYRKASGLNRRGNYGNWRSGGGVVSTRAAPTLSENKPCRDRAHNDDASSNE
jgi:hypothetical protein